MPSYNLLVLAGNVTRDPEIRYVNTGAAVCKFSLAVNYRKKGGDEVLYVDCVAWDKLAEIANTYLRKGSGVLVQGRLTIRKYETKDGGKGTAVECVVGNLQLLDSRPGGERQDHAPAQRPAPAQQQYDDFDPDSDIPF